MKEHLILRSLARTTVLVITVFQLLSSSGFCQVVLEDNGYDIHTPGNLELDETPYVPVQNPSILPLIFEKNAKNVILMICDGMGLATVDATRFELCGPDGRLHMETMPVTGLVSTHSAKQLITDSAAAGTAMACGVKTKNGMIGITPDSTTVPSILELARDRGLSTGLVATSSITHATPASFVSHVPSRGQQAEIARQLVESGITVFLGGGKGYFIPSDARNSARKDNLDLINILKKNGYSIVTNRDELMSSSSNKLAGLFQNEALTTRLPEPMLAEMTEKAIDVLSQNEDGFFLMVEGSQVDWGGHQNNADYTIRETILFDDAVRVALEFAKQDGNTLVIVTSDHETGGLTLPKSDSKKTEFKLDWSTGSHSAVNVPLYAYGPGSLRFSGVLDNTAIFFGIKEVYGF